MYCMMIMYSMMISLATLMLWMKHPLSMGSILVAQTLIIALSSGMMLNNFFFSYIIMIIMLSGALVLFTYMASVASNEKFKTSISVMILPMITFPASMYFITFTEMYEYMNNCNIINSTINLIKMFNMMSAYMTIMVIIYLLITMIIVSFIASSKEGPLRMKIYE
uniref:NADH dehydrogenase subunit 6 n=1 Tax=Tectocoris diophthalmus TaxID=159956 RepID=A0A2P1CMP2_9HEMI|nr:NADH dehydrogenase subunit 6 [Tectocoris diophthalmus]